MVLSTQIAWSENIEAALTSIAGGGDMTLMQGVLSNVEATLNVLADTVLMEQPPLRRRKLEHLVRGNFSTVLKECCPIKIVSEIPFLLHLRLLSWCTNVM